MTAAIGVSLGFLLGLITGLEVALLGSFGTRRGLDWKSITAVINLLLTIPVFWFGGPWLTGRFIQSMDMKAVFPFYVISLAVTFGAICLYLFIPYVRRLTTQMGAEPSEPEVQA